MSPRMPTMWRGRRMPKSEAEQFDRLIRGQAALNGVCLGLWLIDAGRRMAHWRRACAAAGWSSDSVVMATQQTVGDAPDSPSGRGMPVRLGPVRGCAAGSPR